MDEKKFNWDEFAEFSKRVGIVAVAIGVLTGVLSVVYFSCASKGIGSVQTYAELKNVEADDIFGYVVGNFLGWGVGAFGVVGCLGILIYPLVCTPIRYILNRWPIWATPRYWLFTRNPGTVSAAYYEIEEALNHLSKDRSPEAHAAKLCLQRAITGCAPTYYEGK
tara:strand:- start:938 stop:1432 length:495 start_codon:yes stop_codon:yes gene_type:complete